MLHPPGLIGVLTGDVSRYSWFHQSLLSLLSPPGSSIVFCQGLWIATAVNRLIATMEPQHEWICLLADDHIFEPDMLLRLLDHQVHIVAPLCCLRRLPYAPSLFQKRDGIYQGYTWGELAGLHGLLPVAAMGGPGVVIRREVLDALGAPWFENMPGEREAPHEDLYFFEKCGDAGYVPYADLDLSIGHILAAAVYPHRQPSCEYAVRLWAHQDLALLMPTPGQRANIEEYHAVTP